MRAWHALIIAGAILGAAWIMKPVPTRDVTEAQREARLDLLEWEVLSQQCLDSMGKTWATLDRNDPKQRDAFDKCMSPEAERCYASIGKTRETFDSNDPQQMAAYRKCRWPEREHGWLRRTWNRIISALIW